eukprot:TRINITY_DN743_c0_g1_i1.p1 TRINITY_DN743_c0_g1~~TRINITY_DN743_c0_g1_i1.p1  ORF type:complete len:179 (+),score=12.08 TRINITY_DN743_c0_g1_i1:45-581(+)
MQTSKGLVVVLAEDQYECLEVHYPRLRFMEAGYTVKVVGPRAKEKFLSKEGYWAITDSVFADINPKEVKALIIPGGLLCPDRLRRYPDCLNLVSQAKANGAVIGAICHGPWVAISAKILKGVKCTCFFAIKDDVINAGGEYSEQKVVVDKDHRIVTAQVPDDVAEFMKQILILLEGTQ